jgi:hypothetical protein
MPGLFHGANWNRTDLVVSRYTGPDVRTYFRPVLRPPRAGKRIAPALLTQRCGPMWRYRHISAWPGHPGIRRHRLEGQLEVLGLRGGRSRHPMDLASRRAAGRRAARGKRARRSTGDMGESSFPGRRVLTAGRPRSLDRDAHSIAPPKRYLAHADPPLDDATKAIQPQLGLRCALVQPTSDRP